MRSSLLQPRAGVLTRNQPCRHLGPGFLGSRSVKKAISVVWALLPVVLRWLQKKFTDSYPREMNTTRSKSFMCNFKFSGTPESPPTDAQGTLTLRLTVLLVAGRTLLVVFPTIVMTVIQSDVPCPTLLGETHPTSSCPLLLLFLPWDLTYVYILPWSHSLYWKGFSCCWYKCYYTPIHIDEFWQKSTLTPTELTEIQNWGLWKLKRIIINYQNFTFLLT